MKRGLRLVAWLAAVSLSAAAGAIASLDAPSFYASLDKPVWAPPAGVFGPVWTVLYVLMAIAAWRVDLSPRPHRGALTLFVVQLVANGLWSWIFFAWKRGALATVDVLGLVVLVAATLIAFWRHSRLAGALLVPYLAWVCFASALTVSVWLRNPVLLS